MDEPYWDLGFTIPIEPLIPKKTADQWFTISNLLNHIEPLISWFLLARVGIYLLVINMDFNEKFSAILEYQAG